MLTCKTLRGKQPVYLHSMLAASLSSCSLRSNKRITLSAPVVKTNVGVRAFQSCTPSLWEQYPSICPPRNSIAIFRICLKTHLFNLYCIDILITRIVSIIHLSLTEGSFPLHLKSAHVYPLLKKPFLSKDSMNNYRPGFNLIFLSKVLDKVVVNQLNSHINSSNTSNQYQSAYRTFQSTKADLLKIHNGIIVSMDAGKVTALTLLDLSAAFDTIDHTILLRRLDDWFGATGKALHWFQTCLTGRCQSFSLGDRLSFKADLKFGVSQGSDLGPLLFTLYTTPLSSKISGHAIPHHLYADDNQLYVSFASGDSAAALNGLQSCLFSVQSWMLTNKSKLNPDKTEFPLIGNE